MMPERQEDVKYGTYYMPFGCGPHYCPGRDYAQNHLTAFLCILAKTCDWQRKLTK